jgi:dihydroorotate dehydrogenase electron transfer subunit
MAKKTEDFLVVDNRQIKKDFFILELAPGDPLPDILPGQFVQARVDGSPETFLRRPLSIHDIDYEKNTIKLLIQVLGKGTETLSKLRPGESLNLVYPLGNSFTIPSEDSKVLLVGGGCGIAPLLYLARVMSSKNIRPDIILGFRNADRILEYDEYLKFGSVFITTEDGSTGEKGFVTSHSILKSSKYDLIGCCGPEPMMKAVSAYAMQSNTECEVSLENLMACGFGICLCCIVSTTRGNICTCTEGPVFNIKELKW